MGREDAGARLGLSPIEMSAIEPELGAAKCVPVPVEDREMRPCAVGLEAHYGVVFICCVWAWGGPSVAAQPVIFEQPLSPRIANYNIRVTLDDVAKRIEGDLMLTWHNPSDDAIDHLQFHLYANAFRNARSTFLRETLHRKGHSAEGGEPSETAFEEDNGWGGIRIARMTVDGEDVSQRISFFQPDDDNADDQTVIRVPLTRPVAPRATAQIAMEFAAQIPRCEVRTGWWQDDFFMMVHWFPKIGVYEAPGTRFVPSDAPRGRWNCHQFHSGTEFYADFGVYDVQITLPGKYIVGASGVIVDQRANGDGTKTVVAHAEDVHEFAWVADAQFLETKDVWRCRQTGREVAIRLLHQPAHGNAVDKYMAATKKSLDFVHEWLGADAYPYPNVTVVDPRNGSGAAGMEYPTLFTGGQLWWLETLLGDGQRLVEGVTVHEFLHQIWFGIVATNEFEEAWLDEGLTVYSTTRVLDEWFDPRRTLVDWWGGRAGNLGMSQAAYALDSMKNDGAIADPTFAHWHRSVGFTMAYDKPALMLATLENYLGRERFDRIMRTYYQRWRFRHPGRADFLAVVHEVAGENLDWFFEQVLEEATSLDYAVASIANVPLKDFEKGILDDELQLPEGSEEDEQEEDEEEDEENGPYESTVVFRRVGEVVFPMDVLIEFSDGEVIRTTWDGRGRVRPYRFTRDARVIRATIDPDNRVPLDVDRLNNSVRVEENDIVTNKYTFKGLFWMQSLLQFFSILS